MVKEAQAEQVTRPQPPRPSNDSANVVVAKTLSGNLGTSPEISSGMRIDERKFSVQNDLTLTALSYLDYRGKVDKIRFWDFFVDWELCGAQGIKGLARRHILQALAASAGNTGSVGSKAQRPGMFARNVWKRDWKDKAYGRGEIVEEDE